MAFHVDDYEWLVSDAGCDVVHQAMALGGDELAIVSKLRKVLSPIHSRLVAEQVRLRNRAKRKYRLADQMLFTQIGLEQATSESLASYKAARFAHLNEVADLCCGIGGDSIALGEVTRLTCVDLEPSTALLCRHNLRAYGISAKTQCAEASALKLGGYEGWHIDPDRRAFGKRTIAPEAYSPSWADIELMVRRNPNAAIKLAPASRFQPERPGAYELEWIGQGRECQQQVAWVGELALNPGSRCATVLATDGSHLGTIHGTGHERATESRAISPFVIEPHSAVIAAGLVGALATQARLMAFERQVAYLTADRPFHDFGTGCFELIASTPFDERSLRRELKRRDLFPEEIKKRRVPADPHKLAKQLRKTGSQPCTLILTPAQGQTLALITRRVAPSSDPSEASKQTAGPEPHDDKN